MDLTKLSDAELNLLLRQQPRAPEPAKPVEPERSVWDRAKGAYSAVDAGVGAGIAGAGGLPRLAADAMEGGLYGAVDKGRKWLGQEPFERPKNSLFGQEHWPSSESMQKEIQNKYYGGVPAYEPKDILERYLKTIGEFSIGGAGGPNAARTVLGKVAQTAGKVVAPAVVSETAGQAASALTEGDDSEYAKYAEPVARFVGALTGGFLHGVATRPSSARAVIEQNMPGITPAEIAAADALIQRSHGPRSVPLTWSEALSQVTGRPVMSDLTRHLEGSSASKPQMDQFFGQRPQQVERAVDTATEALSPGVSNPNLAGPRAADAAKRVISDVRNSITDATRPLYDAAGQHLVPQQVHAAMMANPLFAQTVEEIRRHPALSQLVGPRSDRSIQMYDAVAKQLEQQATNAANPLHPQANLAIPGVAGGLGGDVKNIAVQSERAATHGPSAYEAALARQTELRRDVLDPELHGPTGRVAAATDTPQARQALLPAGGPTAGEHLQIGRTTRDIAARDPTAASNLVRNHVETLFNDAANDLVSGPAQAGGAKFRQRLLGNRQEARNVQAVIENATPDGPERWQGLMRLMDILEATGTRLNVGSKTAYNQEIRETMKSGVPATVKAAASPMNLFKPMVDKFEGWKYGKNLKEIGSIMTDPRAAPMLREIAENNVNSWAGARAAMKLLNYVNAVNARQTDEPSTMLPPITVTK